MTGTRRLALSTALSYIPTSPYSLLTLGQPRPSLCLSSTKSRLMTLQNSVQPRTHDPAVLHRRRPSASLEDQPSSSSSSASASASASDSAPLSLLPPLIASSLLVVVLTFTSFTNFSGPSLAANSAPTKGPISGHAKVIDGDTLIVSGVRIRLLAIDAPELSQICVHPQSHAQLPCGVSAKSALQSLVDSADHGDVTCIPKNTDRYGRTVASCYANKVDIAASLVSSGHAVAYRQYGTQYVALEQEAKTSSRGIWATQFDKPWEWRKTHKHANRDQQKR